MPVEYLKETPSQTAGPYVHIGTLPAAAGLPLRTQENLHVLANAQTPGEHIRLEGIVYDGAGAPVKDAMLEIWQADSHGRYDAPGFLGWGRAAADFDTGEWFFETVKPGATAGRNGTTQAPHISVLIFARGINIHLHTRAYFSDEEAANAADPVLRAIEQRNRAPTLIAQRSTRGGQTVYRFDIWLQHDEKETVFFDM
jgi:protocatechuate 3,4-dioxygenase alpha subunit